VAKRPTRDDVAGLAGVSVATVSYVVNNGPRHVSDAARARVLQAIAQLGYRPHAIARSLKTGNTATVGLLIPTLVSPGFPHLINAVEDCLAARDYALVLASSHEDPERERRMLDVLASQSIDGLLFTPTSSRHGGAVMQLMEQGMPVVFLDRNIPGVPADTVMTDNVRAARQATEFLIGRRCRRILCVSFSHEASSALDRVQGYSQALRQHDLPLDERMVLVIPDPSGEGTSSALEAYRASFGWPDGILCLSQMHTISVVRALRQRGIRIPDQVAIVGGFFVSPWDMLLEPPLPLVNQNMEYMAQQAVEFLMQRLRGDNPPPRAVLLDAELVVDGVSAFSGAHS
jgi:DNA-binding LacI/PurR family transcriptional regulator